MFMNIPRRMVVFLLCLVLIIVALTGCLGGGDTVDDGGDDQGDGGDGGDSGDGDSGDGDSGDGDSGDGTGGNAGEIIVTEDDLPTGWYYFNWTQAYGYDYPVWQGDFGSVAITYFSNNEDVMNSTEFLIVGVLDFDSVTGANYWYDNVKLAAESEDTVYNLGVGDEGFYVDNYGDGSDIAMYFRNGEVCVFMNYFSDDSPLSISEVIDLAEIQNGKI